MNNYYEDLNISRDADIDTIHQAYKRLALKYHPDRNLNNIEDAKNKFKIVNAAYEVLSNSIKKAEYDSKGYVGRRPNNYQPQKPKYKQKTKEDFEREREEKKKNEELEKNSYKKEPTNVECSFFGGGANQGRSILVHLKLTDSELKNGVLKNFLIKKRDFCMPCGGVVYDYFPCKYCLNDRIKKMACGFCDTQGIVLMNCPSCNGSGFGNWVIKELSYKIPPNSKRGNQYNIIGAGEELHNKTPGNVRIFLI